MKNKTLNFIKVLLAFFFLVVVIIAIINVVYMSVHVVSIGEDAFTAKQLAIYCDDYIRKFGKNNVDWYLTNIVMDIDDNHLGKVTMIYSYEIRGRIRSYEISMNTKEHMI